VNLYRLTIKTLMYGSQFYLQITSYRLYL